MSPASLVSILLLCTQPQAVRADQGWGTIQGRVIYSGTEVPAPKIVAVNREQAHCLSKGPIASEDLVVNKKNKGVQWVIVWLCPVKKGIPLPIQPDLIAIKQNTVVIDQPCCRFEPHILGMRQGQDLEAKNSGKVSHNVHWFGRQLTNPGDNIIVSAGKSLLIKDLKADEKAPVKIQCDFHGWMSAWVYVFNHPYFAVTGTDGSLKIKKAPAGTYNLRNWSDNGYGPGGRDGEKVTIEAKKVTQVTIKYPP
jgi:hypothetical protein